MTKIVADFWYGKSLDGDVAKLDEWLNHALGTRLASLVGKIAPLRAIALLIAGREADVIVPAWYRYGRFFCVLQALLSTRKVWVLEFIDVSARDRGLTPSRFLDLLRRFVWGPAMRRSTLGVQTMTEWERIEFARRYNFPLDRVHCIKWPLAYPTQAAKVSLETRSHDRYVFSSGRAACDWPTLFAACRAGGWPLKVVCSRKDYHSVLALSQGTGAQVFTEIPIAQHDKLLAGATVTVISLYERNASAGQIRLGNANVLGVPVVATNIRGLNGYLVDGINALACPVGDPESMAAKVKGLFDDEPGQRRLIDSARAHVQPFTEPAYFRDINAMIQRSLTSERNLDRSPVGQSA